MTSARRFSFTAAHRVSDGVHRDAANVGANPLPAIAAGLPDLNGTVLNVSHTTNGRLARDWNATDFARRKRDLRPTLLAGVEHGTRTSGTTKLGATARHHLNVVNRHAQRNLVQRHAGTHNRVRTGAGENLVAG